MLENRKMNIIRQVRKSLPILSIKKHYSAKFTKPSLLLNPVQKLLYSTDQEIKLEIKQNRIAPHIYRCSVNDPVILILYK